MSSGQHKETITHFSDQHADHKVEGPSLSDPTYGCADASNVGLAEFFSRPIKLQSFSWNVGNGVLANDNVWSLYFNNPRVINRITNYRNIRCRLHIKIVLNGNGFHYGRLLASYLPYADIDTITKQGRSTIQDAVEESQRMHLYLDPSISQGGTLSLPFFWHKNNLDVVTEEWDDMGRVVIRSLQNLAHANGATDSVTVSIFGWITDVVLSGPTSTDSGALVAQSGEYSPQASEYMDTPVSSIANTIAAISSTLSLVPMIEPFAKATEMAATAIGKIAKMFGYSRPNVLKPIEPFKPMFTGNMVNANVPDTCTTLAMDCKQELTVDPRTVGLDGKDELSIVSMSQKESYLTQFAWDIADSSETLLWNCQVSPALYDTVGTGDSKEFHMTAMCYASHPFTYWRGTINFRFMCVASAYQKGRLRIVYDPWLKTGTEYNTNYNTIIDLAEERDFTVSIGWANSRSYLKILHAQDQVTLPFSTSSIVVPNNDYINGVISVYVVNELTTPNSTVTNNAAVNVFVNTSDDFEVVVPNSHALQNMTVYDPSGGGEVIVEKKFDAATILSRMKYKPHSGEYECQAGSEAGHADSDHTNDASAPVQSEIKNTMGAEELSTDNTLQVYFSDPVASFRFLMKRYTHSLYSGINGTATAAQRHRFVLPNMPLDPGYDPNGIHSVTTPINPTVYNFTNMTLLRYCSWAFAGYRGAVRWKIVPDVTSAEICQMTCTNMCGEDHVPITSGTIVGGHQGTSLSTQASDGQAAHDATPGGVLATVFDRNPVLEVEVPFYSFDRFIPTRATNPASSSDRYHELVVSRRDTGVISGMLGFDSYCAAGEDYFPCFYIAPPVFYFDSTLPTPV